MAESSKEDVELLLSLLCLSDTEEQISQGFKAYSILGLDPKYLWMLGQR